jgi:sugar phosphate isomerase/epimerase
MNIIGVQAYTVRDFMADEAQVNETLGKLSKIGYCGIESGIPAGLTATAFKAMLDSHGLKPLSVGGSIYSLMEDPSKAVADARVLGVDTAFVGSIPDEMRGSEDGYHQFAKDLNRAGEHLKKEGLKLTYHNHAFEFFSFGGYNGMDILLNETTEDVYFLPDTHWLAAAGVNPPDFIRRLAGRCFRIHCKDYGIDNNIEILESVPRVYAEVGRGNLNWPDIVRACRETGITTFVVEQDFCKGDPFASLEISYKAVKSLGL